MPTFPKRRFPQMPKALLKTPPGYRRPRTEDFKRDMQRLGEEIAEEFKNKVEDNIKNNTYGFEDAPSTVGRKDSDTPLVDTGELLSAIYREGTVVSVRDTLRSDSDLTNKELAIILEYGTKDQHIPARPVWRNTSRDFKEHARKRVEKFFKTRKFK